MNVFVYGSLRKYESNHRLLASATLVAMQARVLGRLVDTGYGFPAMVVDEHIFVYGEVYYVNEQELAALDRLEGYHGVGKNNLYDRVTTTVETDSGALSAYVYLYTDIHAADGMPTVPFADWRTARVLQNQETLDYFAYGSVMDDERLIEDGVDGEFQDVAGCGVLTGYHLCFSRQSFDGSGRADIIEASGRVEGKVYRIGRSALDYLFGREGVGVRAYRPALVDVEVKGQLHQDVLVFLNIDKQREICPPDWYVDEILRGGKGWLSDEYLDSIRRRVYELQGQR